MSTTSAGEIWYIEDTGSESNKSHLEESERALSGTMVAQGSWADQWDSPELIVPSSGLFLFGYSDFLRFSGTIRSLASCYFHRVSSFGAYVTECISDNPFYFYILDDTDLTLQNVVPSTDYDGATNTGGTLVGNGLINEFSNALGGDSFYIAMADSSEINVNDATFPAKTVEAIVRIDDINTLQCIYEQGGGTSGVSLSIDGGYVYFTAYSNSDALGPGDDWGVGSVSGGHVYASLTLSGTGTYYISGVYVQESSDDAYDGELKLYVGDVTNVGAGLLSNVNSSDRIGKLYSHIGDINWAKVFNAYIGSTPVQSNPSYFDGALNAIAYYNLELTEQQITDHFNACNDECDVVEVTVSNPRIQGVTSNGYNRGSGGADESSRHGIYLDYLRSGSTVKIIEGAQINGSDRVGDYDRTIGDPRGLWAVNIGEDRDYLFCKLSVINEGSGVYTDSPRPIDLGTPSALSSGTWKELDSFINIGFMGETITNFGSAFTVAANSKVLVGANFQTSGSTSRESVLIQIEKDGVPYCYISIYNRNDESDMGIGSILVPMVTGGSSEVIKFKFVSQVGDGSIDIDIQDAFIGFIDITDSDVIILGKTDSDITDHDNTSRQMSFPVSDELQKDASFEHADINPTRVQNNANEEITVLAGGVVLWDRSSDTNADRVQTGHCLRKTGVDLDYACWSEYNRGYVSSEPVFISGSSFGAPVVLGVEDYLEFSYYDYAQNGGSKDIVLNCTDGASVLFWAVRIDGLGDVTSDTFLLNRIIMLV